MTARNNFHLELDAEDEPLLFQCPITKIAMDDPVVTSLGEVYERAAIEEWYKTHNSDPMSGRRVPSKTLFPVNRLKSEIKEWKQRKEASSSTHANLADDKSQTNPSRISLSPSDQKREEKNHFALPSVVSLLPRVSLSNNVIQAGLESKRNQHPPAVLSPQQQILNDNFLSAVSENRPLRAIQFLLQGANKEAKDNSGATAIIIAAKNNFTAVFTMLWHRFRPNLNAQDNSGNTALHHAVIRDHKDFWQYLLIRQANSNIRNHLGLTPDDLVPDHERMSWNIFAGREPIQNHSSHLSRHRSHFDVSSSWQQNLRRHSPQVHNVPQRLPRIGANMGRR